MVGASIDSFALRLAYHDSVSYANRILQATMAAIAAHSDRGAPAETQ